MKRFADYYQDYNPFYEDYNWKSLKFAAEHFGIEVNGSYHRSHTDAELLRQILNRLEELTYLVSKETGVSDLVSRNLASNAPEIGAMDENQKNIVQISKLIDKLEVLGYNRDSYALKHSLNEVMQGNSSNIAVLSEEIYDIKRELVL